MSEPRVSPCAYPRCADHDGRPRLTQDTFCDTCQRRYRKLLDWLALDYAALREMPKPAVMNPDGSKHQSPKAKSFGHPNEWASDTMRELAAKLNWIEDALREELGHEPPPHPGVQESHLVAHAYRYLVDQFSRLITYSAAPDTAEELNDLHYDIRRRLGHTRFVQWLPTPCPWCDTAALVRDVDHVECGACGKKIKEALYGWLTGWIIDRVIEEYDARQAELA